MSFSAAPLTMIAHQVGMATLRNPQTVRDPRLPTLRDYHRAWKDGRLSTDELRESLVWLWLALGQSMEEEIARELFEATGYVTDSPHITFPRTLRVYQGRAAGEPPMAQAAAKVAVAVPAVSAPSDLRDCQHRGPAVHWRGLLASGASDRLERPQLGTKRPGRPFGRRGVVMRGTDRLTPH